MSNEPRLLNPAYRIPLPLRHGRAGYVEVEKWSDRTYRYRHRGTPWNRGYTTHVDWELFHQDPWGTAVSLGIPIKSEHEPPAHEPDTVAEEMLEALRRENERLRALIAKAWEDGFVEGADGFAPDPDRPTEYTRAALAHDAAPTTEDTP